MNRPRPVSIVTVAYDSHFFVRLLVERVRTMVGPRDYEIIVVDRGSRDGTREWVRQQPDVRLVAKRQWGRRHSHGEAAEAGARGARHPVVVLMDSDAHPVDPGWLEMTADRLDSHWRLAGAEFHGNHRQNPYGRYIHPHFMAFWQEDLGHHVVLRKLRGDDTDTGEEATIRLLDARLGVLGHPIEFCERFAVGNTSVPTVSAGVFHAWYATRLAKEARTVQRETDGAVSGEAYLAPLQARLREAYRLEY
jgi:glycosyltransferase involved in cell wall biosynthesis